MCIHAEEIFQTMGIEELETLASTGQRPNRSEPPLNEPDRLIDSMDRQASSGSGENILEMFASRNHPVRLLKLNDNMLNDLIADLYFAKVVSVMTSVSAFLGYIAYLVVVACAARASSKSGTEKVKLPKISKSLSVPTQAWLILVVVILLS
jgi:hypothetical protein